MHGGRCAGSAMVTAVIRGGSTSMRTAIFRSPRGACNSQECSTLSIRFNLGENCYNVRSSSARSHPMWAGTPGFVEQSSHAGGDARTPPLTLFNGRTVTPCGRGRPRTRCACGSIILHVALVRICCGMMTDVNVSALWGKHVCTVNANADRRFCDSSFDAG